ncbi:hypothetical protein TCAL_14615 [Tigriopus californicus]|uniref:Uncharacterized protein n=1 Tax=Tigriopus californicus TaxID=6832 RepID=A0A553PB74_TIGCA|nr:hypothetical protein TCAL_14615 [Tigriopus californicus]
MKTNVRVGFLLILLDFLLPMSCGVDILKPAEAEFVIFYTVGKHDSVIRHRRFIADRGLSANLHALLFFTGYRTGIRVNDLYDRVFGNEGTMERKRVMAEIKALEKNATRIQNELDSATLGHLEEIMSLQKNVTLLRDAHRQEILEVLELSEDDNDVLVVDEGCFDFLDDMTEDPKCDIWTILF